MKTLFFLLIYSDVRNTWLFNIHAA